MTEDMPMQVIARIRNDFSGKFGIPYQSGLVEELKSYIVFEPGFRNADMIRGLEGFSHIWLLWQFSQSKGWSPMVRPPRLGGNTRIGVLATRSPFRPSPLGLSCVKLEQVTPYSRLGPILRVAGADLMNGTPIYDIKPYLPYTDSKPYAEAGFTATHGHSHLDVDCPEEELEHLPEDRRAGLLAVLAQDPRPAYQHDPQRIYGFGFAGFNIRFSVRGSTLTVLDITPNDETAPAALDAEYVPQEFDDKLPDLLENLEFEPFTEDSDPISFDETDF